MSWVYFIRPIGMLGPVKIGYSSHPESRLLGLGCWSPFPLEVIATIPGDGKLERRFHTKFAHLHSHHEWFHSSPEIEAAIGAIKAGTFDLDAELPKRGRNLHKRNPHVFSLAKRQALGLAARLRNLTSKTGYGGTAKFERRVLGFENLSPTEQTEVLRQFRDLIADPMKHGRAKPWAWAKPLAVAYRKSRRHA